MARVVAVIVCSFGLAAFTSSALADGIGPLVWQPPVRVVPVGHPLGAIACPSALVCVAASGPFVATSSSAGDARGWRLHRVLPDTASCGSGSTCPEGVVDVSCPSLALCVAIGNRGYVLDSTDPAALTPTWNSISVNDSLGPFAVSCASLSLCVAVGLDGDAFVSTAPTAGRPAWRPIEIDATSCPPSGCHSLGSRGAATPIDVACPSASLCVAADLTAHILTTTDPAGDPGPWSAALVDPNTGYCGHLIGCPTAIETVRCPSAELCVATDEAGYALASADPAGGADTWKLAPLAPDRDVLNSGVSAPSGALQPFADLACPSTSRCVALSGEYAYVTDEPLAGRPWRPERIDPGGSLRGISCPSATRCLAVDAAGRLLRGRAGPTPHRLHVLLGAQLKPRGTGSRIGHALQHQAFVFPFTTPVPGTVGIRWIYRATARRAGVTIARGTHRFRAAGTARPRLALTKTGRAVLRHRAHVHVTAIVTFSSGAYGSLRIARAIHLR